MTRIRTYALAALAFLAALATPLPAGAAPSYMSYFGLAWNIPETQDHVNLWWAVSWDWDSSEVLSELASAKARGMRAIVHVEFVFFNGSGPYANTCPYTVRPDGAARWDAFVQTLSAQGLLDTVAAFYPLDEPDLCGVSPSNVLALLNIIRAHPLTAGKPIGVIFSCDIAKKFGGPYQSGGAHQYGTVLRAYDWVGFDCYDVGSIFTDAAWRSDKFDFGCFCFPLGPSYYDNFKLQLTNTQRVILVPQGFVNGEDVAFDNPQPFWNKANADPSVILMAPFTWFDQRYSAGIRSQPLLAQQWRDIGRAISLANPPLANPPLPPPQQPRLQVTASNVARFSINDITCNTTTAQLCEIEVFWWLANASANAQVFFRQGASAPLLLSCSSYKGYVDLPWISSGNFRFEIYQMANCPSTIPANATPVATLDVSLTLPAAPPTLTAIASRKVHGSAGTHDLALAITSANPSTEPRTTGTGNHTLVFKFNKPVTGGTVSVTEGVATAGTPTFSADEMVVPLSDVANAQYVTVSVSNVVSSDGATGGSGSVRLGFLAGDVNSNRVVTLSDMLVANAVLAQNVTPGNFLSDVNASGTLTLSDLIAINANLTLVLPAP